MSVPMKMVPVEERPRERLLRHGAESLTDVELLAILLRTGIRGLSVIELAEKVMHHCEEQSPGSGLARLLQLKDDDLRKIAPGIGQAKLCQVLAALQLGWRAKTQKLKVFELSNPHAVYEHLAPRFSLLEQEQFVVILLNAKNHVIDVESVTTGTLTSSLVHPREVFKPAIRRSAHAIILAHNHPSGDPAPSREDREVTQRLVQAGKQIGIEVLDHLVIGNGRYFSFHERGLLERS